MAQDITLDSIIRRNLAKRKLPLHYYSAVLVIAKEGLDDMHFHTLQKVKIATLTLDADLMTADLPEDYVEAVFVGLETGDKVRPIGDNHRINKKDDEGTPFEPEADLYVSGASYTAGNYSLDSHYSEYGAYNGKNFGRPVTFTDSYTIIRELGKIRVDHKSDATEIQLTYLSLPEKVSNKSVIHPFAKQTLNDWIDWQWAKYNKEQDQEMRRRDYFNSNRILRGMLNKLTTVEIKRTIRNKINLAIKN
jgi:hypothetical protein